MKILMLANMSDLQTGPYIFTAFEKLGHDINYIDVRAIIRRKGYLEGQQTIIDNIAAIPEDPDVIMMLKGLELTPDTILKIKTAFPKTKLINWFFDVYFSGAPIWEEESSFPIIRLYDYFLCSLKGVAQKLQEKGFSNVHYVPEACSESFNAEVPVSLEHKRRYSCDITFIGSIGLVGIHKKRIEYLSRIIKEGGFLSIWGGVLGDSKNIPEPIKTRMKNAMIINKEHSLICQTSTINLGLDQDISLDESWSARLYRIMCSGGLYLSTPTKGLENHFRINEEHEEITIKQDLVVFYDEDDMVEKIEFLLDNPDIAERIGLNGQQTVLKAHTFKHRIKQIIKLIGEQ